MKSKNPVICVIWNLVSGLGRVDLTQRSRLPYEAALLRLSEGIDGHQSQVIPDSGMSTGVRVVGSVSRSRIYLRVRRIGGPKNSWHQVFTGSLVPVDGNESELRGSIGVDEAVSLFSLLYLALSGCCVVIGIIGLTVSSIFFGWSSIRPFIFISAVSIAALGVASGLVTLAPRASLWEKEYIEEWVRKLLADG